MPPNRQLKSNINTPNSGISKQFVIGFLNVLRKFRHEISKNVIYPIFYIVINTLPLSDRRSWASK